MATGPRALANIISEVVNSISRLERNVGGKIFKSTEKHTSTYTRQHNTIQENPT